VLGHCFFLFIYTITPVTSTTGSQITGSNGAGKNWLNGDASQSLACGLLTTNIAITVYGVSPSSNGTITMTVSNATVVSATDCAWDLYIVVLPNPFSVLAPEEEKMVALMKKLGFKMPKGAEPNRFTIEKESKTGRFAVDNKEEASTTEDLLRYTREELMTWKHRAQCADDELKQIDNQLRNAAVACGYKPKQLCEPGFTIVEPPSPEKWVGSSAQAACRALSPERAAAAK